MQAGGVSTVRHLLSNAFALKQTHLDEEAQVGADLLTPL